MNHRNVWMTIALLAGPALLHGQWLEQPTPGIPRAANGTANLTAPVPHSADGKPKLAGVWLTESGKGVFSPEGPPSKYFSDILADLKGETGLMRPSTAAAMQKFAANEFLDAPISHCQPAGVPLADMMTNPYKVVETPGLILMLYERDMTFRQIFTDGRKMPADPQPTWLGYSVGHWDGDTLVVETSGLDSRSWLDARGHTHSDALRVTERFHRIDFGHMDLQVTIDDPKAYTKSFTYTLKQYLMPDTDLLEYFCSDNEKDAGHYKTR